MFESGCLKLNQISIYKFISLDQYMTSYTVAFLSPEPVAKYLSSPLMSHDKTDEDSCSCRFGNFKKIKG